MNATPYKKSPLAHRTALTSDLVSMSEKPFLTKLMLRGERDVLDAAIKGIAAGNAPENCRSVFHDALSVHWIGPDTTIVIGEGSRADEAKEQLTTALADKHAQLTSVSNHYTAIELKGEKARAVLQKLSTLDLDPSQFSEADFAGTMLGHSQVFLSCRETQPDCFHLLIRRSHADYLWCLLAHAAYEFGLDRQAVVSGEKLRQ